MSTFEKISPDDPRLTAFALGEMEPAERGEFEKLLKQDADARATVAAITGTVHSIGVALAGEPVPTVTVSKPKSEVSQIDRDYANPPGGMASLLRFPQLYFTISGFAAACFAIGLVIWEARQVPVHYTEVDLTKLVPADTVKAKGAAEAETEVEVGFQPASGVSKDEVVSLDSKEEKDNAFLTAKDEPVSTFPIKTDTAAYANVRHFVEHGQRPPSDAVRIEELVNYFPYRYTPPENSSADREVPNGAALQTKHDMLPFAAHLEVASAPWAPEHRLVRIGLKGGGAQKVPVTPGGSATILIAKDVKLQVEFNPAQVLAYRLIGYENRMPRKEDLNNDKIDAGEVGAGHTVTALYEVVPAGVEWQPESSIDGLKYKSTEGTSLAGDDVASKDLKMAASDELLTLKLSYKEPDGDVSKLMEFPLRESGRSFEQASADFKFAASVAAFGMILRESPHKGRATFAKVTEWAQAGLVDDAGGYRAEFVGLVGQAERLMRN